MPGELLYSSDNLDLYLDERWLYADWKGYQSVDMVKAGCEEMLRQLSARKLTRVLNDNSHMSGIWVGAAAWMATDWFPRVREAGLRHCAWVRSPSRLSHISAKTMLEQAAPGSAVMFNNLAAAADWLRQQP